MHPTRRVAPLALVALALVAAPSLAGDDLSTLVDRTVTAYGGKPALEKVIALRATGRLTSTMRGGQTPGTGAIGSTTRCSQGADKLRVVVAFPGQPDEVRVLDGASGWRSGKAVVGPLLDAMKLQAARLALPLALAARKSDLKDLGESKRGDRTVRVIELPFGDTMSVTLEIDTKTARIVRSVGKSASAGMPLEFATEYDDFREVDGVLFAFRETSWAMGQKTGVTTFEKVEVLSALPPETFKP